MPYIRRGGVKYLQVRHAILCKRCMNTLESVSIHDFKMCPCGLVGIDGGIEEGNRILGNPENYLDRRVYCFNIGNRKYWLNNDE